MNAPAPNPAARPSALPPRRILSIVLTILAVLCLVTAVSDFHVDSCEWKTDNKTPVTKGELPEKITALSLQVNGGDNAYNKALREAFAATVKEKHPEITEIVDGPQPKGGALAKISLASGDITWTPVWASAELGFQGIIRAGRNELVVEGKVSGTCTGLVSRSVFQAEFGPRAAEWLGGVLDAALAR